MIRAFFLSIGQLGDRAVASVLVKSLGLTLAIFAGAGAAAWYGIDAALAGWQWHGALAGAAATIVTVLALWLLFRAVAVAVVGIFADEVVEAVERRHYPQALATARPVSFHRGLATGLRSAGRVVVVNLLLAPIYIALLVTGVGTAALFFVVNGWLLGRDLGDMVAMRHLRAPELKDWRRRTGPQRFLLGLAGTGLFLVPLINLLAPVLGAAMATHLFHGRTR
jgi:uncharacterized protein involved in cysteine biosynthesis